MGGGNYTLDAPPNSFIDVRDFSTVEALTKYLKYLIDNPVSFFFVNCSLYGHNNRAVIWPKKLLMLKRNCKIWIGIIQEPFVFVV